MDLITLLIRIGWILALEVDLITWLYQRKAWPFRVAVDHIRRGELR